MWKQDKEKEVPLQTVSTDSTASGSFLCLLFLPQSWKVENGPLDSEFPDHSNQDFWHGMQEIKDIRVYHTDIQIHTIWLICTY